MAGRQGNGISVACGHDGRFQGGLVLEKKTFEPLGVLESVSIDEFVNEVEELVDITVQGFSLEGQERMRSAFF